MVTVTFIEDQFKKSSSGVSGLSRGVKLEAASDSRGGMSMGRGGHFLYDQSVMERSWSWETPR